MNQEIFSYSGNVKKLCLSNLSKATASRCGARDDLRTLGYSIIF